MHPGTPITGVKSGTFTIPTIGHDFSGNTRYRITLTVTDSNGLQSTQLGHHLPAEGQSHLRHRARRGDALPRRHRAHDAVRLRHLIGFNHTIEARDQTSAAPRTRSRRGPTVARRRTPSSCPTPTRPTPRPTPLLATAPPAFVQVNSADAADQSVHGRGDATTTPRPPGTPTSSPSAGTTPPPTSPRSPTPPATPTNWPRPPPAAPA